MKQNVMSSIGAVAERVALSVATIRYYEEIGVIPAANRRGSGHRVYGPEHEKALRMAKSLRIFGFPLEKIRQVMGVLGLDGAACKDIRTLAQERLLALREELQNLQKFEQSLAAIITSCADQCPSGSASNCCITRELTVCPSAAAPATASCRPLDRSRTAVPAERLQGPPGPPLAGI